MLKTPVNFLLVRLSIVFLAILILAFFSMSNAIYIAETIQGQAGAINESGKLRMRSYRIANNLLPDFWDSLDHWQHTTLLIREFEEHLSSPRLTEVLTRDQSSPQRIAYNKIKQQWQIEIRPLFDLYLEGIVPPSMSITEGAIINIRNRYLLSVEDFVSNIDGLVTLLEQDMELKIQQLHKYQLIALVLTMILMMAALLLTWRYLILPLRQLLIAAEQTAKADFTFRTDYTGNDEMGRLGQAFNTMSEELSALYRDLEKRVQDKTQVLERSNQSLQFLYQTAKDLGVGSSPQANFHKLLQNLEKVTGLGHGAICLNTDETDNAVMIASTYQKGDYGKQLCQLADCKDCLRRDVHLHQVKQDKQPTQTVISVAIKDQSEQYGVLLLQLGENREVQPWQMQLIESVAQQMGAAINKSHIEAEVKKMALMDERSIIARELHDSLAQSLTFMKIQVSRLYAASQQTESQQGEQHKGVAEVDTALILDELRTGLNVAYIELRQLLNTFRLKPETSDFNQSLTEIVRDLSQQQQTIITLDNQLYFCDFTANEEIHILQIIREALSNVIQHADANQARVILSYQKNQIRICIDDDGVGIPDLPDRRNHYGLVSMRERTQELGGTIEFINMESGGTRIVLVFKPTNKMIPVAS